MLFYYAWTSITEVNTFTHSSAQRIFSSKIFRPSSWDYSYIAKPINRPHWPWLVCVSLRSRAACVYFSVYLSATYFHCRFSLSWLYLAPDCISIQSVHEGKVFCKIHSVLLLFPIYPDTNCLQKTQTNRRREGGIFKGMASSEVACHPTSQEDYLASLHAELWIRACCKSAAH